MPKTLLGVLLVAMVAGCHAPLLPPPVQAPVSVASDVQGQVEVTIRWPYRAQVIPTSTEELRLTLMGPLTRTSILNRPAGASPVSTTSMQVDVGSGYTLAVEAFAKRYPEELDPTLVVASGQSDPFDVLANKVASVRVALVPSFVPVITGFWPTNGGPGTYLTVTGTQFVPSGTTFMFGGTPSSWVQVPDEGTASVIVPDGATSSLVLPIADGVTGVASGTFTVLSELGIFPAAHTVASGDTCVFTASATTSEGASFAAPTVSWALSTDSVGTLSASGEFRATGTGSTEVQVFSGRLLATASVTVP